MQEWLTDVYWLAGEKEKCVATAEAFDVDFGRFYRLAAEGRLDEARVVLTTMPEELRRGPGVLRHLLVGDTDRVTGWAGAHLPESRRTADGGGGSD